MVIRHLVGAVAVVLPSLLLEAIMIRIDQLPRDANGIIQGAWRIVHEDPTFQGALGAVPFESGASTIPTTGRVLQTLVAVYGPSIFIEPWEDEFPGGWILPEWHARGVSSEQLAELEHAPWRGGSDVAPVDDEPHQDDDGAPSPESDSAETGDSETAQPETAQPETAQPEDAGTSPEIPRVKRKR